jgi:hypothetical protein
VVVAVIAARKSAAGTLFIPAHGGNFFFVFARQRGAKKRGNARKRNGTPRVRQ